MTEPSTHIYPSVLLGFNAGYEFSIGSNLGTASNSSLINKESGSRPSLLPRYSLFEVRQYLHRGPPLLGLHIEKEVSGH